MREAGRSAEGDFPQASPPTGASRIAMHSVRAEREAGITSSVRQQPRGVVVLRVANAGRREEVAAADRRDVGNEHFALQPRLHRDVRLQLLLEAAERVPDVGVATLVRALVVLEASAEDRAGGRGLRRLRVRPPDVAVERSEPALRVVCIYGVELV